MRISVVTACFNSRLTIEDTLKSILEQTYFDVELILIDGGSTDGTLAIIDKYANRIAKIISEKDHGIYDALNKGIQAATGDIIGFLHADDVYASSLILEKIVRLFKHRPIDMVYGDLVYSNFSNAHNVVRYWKSGQFSKNKMRWGWFPPHPTLYVNRKIYERYGIFDTSYKIAADYDIMLRFLYDNRMRVAYLPEVMVRMRLGGVSNRNLKSLLIKSREDYMILRNHAVPLPVLALICKNVSKLHQYIICHKGNIE